MPRVHNHGPAEGRGLDCPERVVNGELRGRCLGWGVHDLRDALAMAEALRHWGWTVTPPTDGQTCTGTCRDGIPCKPLRGPDAK